MTRIRELLDALEQGWDQQGAPVAAALRPPAEPARVRLLRSDAHPAVLEAAVAVHGWHDGIGFMSRPVTSSLVATPSSFFLLGVDEAMDEHAHKLRGSEGDTRWYSPTWHPIAVSHSGDALVLASDATTGEATLFVHDAYEPVEARPPARNPEEVLALWIDMLSDSDQWTDGLWTGDYSLVPAWARQSGLVG